MSDPNKKYYRSIPSRNYEKLEGDVSDIQKAVKESRQWLVDWNNRRKATGRFDDQLQDIDYMNKRIANVPVIASSDYAMNTNIPIPQKVHFLFLLCHF